MVMPWMEQGNLHQYIGSHPEVDRYQLCVQLATGVSYLHSVGVVHGDLRANNVLMSQDGALKISNFENATLPSSPLRSSTTTDAGTGPIRWTAPELLQRDDDDNESNDQAEDSSENTRSTQTDIYALGMTMMEIFTGSLPYAEFRQDFSVIRAIDKKQTPKRPKILSGPESRANTMWELLLRCWDHDPSARPDAAMVLTSLEGLVISATRQ
ncbi:kinase-like protein [Ceratobasidium sp. AG-I]|nr:kinase-like protein [Ceratobasidium sp. AG-I]